MAAKTISKLYNNFVTKYKRGAVNARWYARNSKLYRGIALQLVADVIKEFAIKHEDRFHVNIDSIQVLHKYNILRRLE